MTPESCSTKKVLLRNVLARKRKRDFMTHPPHEHAAGRSPARMRMKGAGRERPGREATRESLFV